MPKITFIEADGSLKEVEATNGSSLMITAVQQAVRGIDADCGGGMSCATCHVHIEPEWRSLIGVAQGDELDLISFVDGFEEGVSRLSCQIVVSEDMDGLKVRVPNG